jgi:phosphoglycerate dehydrogenase-like enzyme
MAILAPRRLAIRVAKEGFATSMAESTRDPRLVVMITSPLEEVHANRIASAYADQVKLIYRPDLMPSIRYVGDHNGPAEWQRSSAEQREWLSLLRDAEVLFDFDMRSGPSPFELSPNLKWVQTSSAGVGQTVKRLGVADSELIVTTASGVHAGPLTEFVFGALLFYVKQMARIQADQAAHRWERFCSDELSGKTMAVIGIGRIGRQIATIARAFDMTVWAMARTNTPERASELGVDRLFERADLHAMLTGADCLVLATPHTPDTENLIGRAELAVMPKGSVLINIARGIVIDEEALIAALKSGQLGFAALDVFRTEPLPAESELWDLPSVLINPHSASTATSENAKITDIFIRNLGHYLDGRYELMSPVLDKQRLY